MTSIALKDRNTGRPQRGEPLVRAISTSIGVAAIVCLSGLALLTGYTAPDGMHERMVADMQWRIEAIASPSFQCGADANAQVGGLDVCREIPGFRIKYGRDVRVFSTRYRDPVFIFGLERGLIFTNESISDALVRSEKAAFFKAVSPIVRPPAGG